MYLVQRIEKQYGTHLECVIKYFALLNVLNSLSLSEGEINVLAFSSIRPNLYPLETKEEFCKTFSYSLPSFEGYMYKLVKKGFLIKRKGNISLNKQLHIEFDSLLLHIEISNEK